MLRLQLAQAPSEWRSSQVALAQANERWARDAADGTENTWTNPNWIDHTREATYHLLCAIVESVMPTVVLAVVC